MENDLNGRIAYSKNVIEFVTVGVQYCSFLEIFESRSQVEITDKLTKLLPLLYLKASLLPETGLEYDIYPEVTVTEEDYNYIASKLSDVYRSNDTYLEVFLEDMKYSDTPISASISENIADIYQDIKNFVSVYERGIEENMNEALFACHDNFKLYWGQKLVNVLRALHALKYNMDSESTDDDSGSDNDEETW